MKKRFKVYILAMMAGISGFSQPKVTLEDIFDGPALASQSVSGFKPMADGNAYAKIDVDTLRKTWSLNQYLYKNGKKQGEILNESELFIDGKKLEMRGYQFSPNELYILIETNTENIYRHSTKSHYLLFDRKKKTLRYISKNKGSYATWSPDGKHLVWVRDNNLYLIHSETLEELPITKDGKRNEIIHGATDWVYEEEFSMDRAFAWSPNGEYIAWLRFDESKVPEFQMTMYGNSYPEHAVWKYPKAGEPNSKVTVWTYRLSNGKTTQLPTVKKIDNSQFPSADWSDTDHYIPRILWGNDDNFVYVYRMNRLQNYLDILKAPANGDKPSLLYAEASDTWIDLYDDLVFLPDGDFILSSEKSGYHHIHRFQSNGIERYPITSGKYDIDQILKVDVAAGWIYYSSTELSPMDRNVYRIKTDGTLKQALTLGQGTYGMQFSKNFKWRLVTYSNINTPPVYYLTDSSGKKIRNLELNEKLKNIMPGKGFTSFRFTEITTSEGINLNGWMLFPALLDTTKKYPVLMYVYGGPGSQQVADRWMGSRGWWFQHLAQSGYIVVCVDNRGTGFRGEAFKKITYKGLGYYETIDQIEVAKWLSERPFVNPNRIGIFGWSYGGYMSSLCITQGAAVFKTAVAVAPVTHWRNYDNIYTERYMQRPIDNPEGYKESSPLEYASKLKGNYLLIHGTADDNVHFQHAAEFSQQLVKLGIPFDNAFYTNKAHGISGGKTSLHVYSKITKYLLNNL